jgi:hypothetical protein
MSLTPERAFEIAKREIMAQLPGLPGKCVVRCCNRTPSDMGASVVSKKLGATIHLFCDTEERWYCEIDGEVERQFSADYALRVALAWWFESMNERLAAFDQYTSPPDLG